MTLKRKDYHTINLAAVQDRGGITVRNLDKSYGSHEVLKNLSFELKAGDSLVIKGPSGCGKSTLLRVLAGLEIPDAGEVWFDSRVVSAPGYYELPWLRGIGMVFQAPTLWPHMTVAENITYPIINWPRDKRKQRVAELLNILEIADKEASFPDEISGGQARRVALARAFADSPRFMLLDEPLTNLNHDLKLHLLEYIKTETDKNGSTMIYVTHDSEEAEYISTNILRFEEINQTSRIED
ncbi:MAG: ABC transporter ATP-binding protein [Syntrophomonadaceae bacterium]|jgi:iron(III) transport system ATP-binding protein